MTDLRSRFVRDASYALGANVVTLSVNAVAVLVAPRALSVESYGLLQLYVFYSGYVGICHLGWVDGVYLLHGGQSYASLDRGRVGAQFWGLVLSQVAVAAGIVGLAVALLPDADSRFLAMSVAGCLLLTNARFFLLYLLQATSAIRTYALITIFDRLGYLVALLTAFFAGALSFRTALLLDLSCKALSLLLALVFCRRIVLMRDCCLSFVPSETAAYIRSGSSLLFGGMASSLVVGVMRFGVDRAWGVAAFGLISLSLNLSLIVTSTVNSIGVVLFPTLRRMGPEQLPRVYRAGRSLLSACVLGALVMYFPARPVLNTLLPSYRASFAYLATLLPLGLFESRMALLIIPYLKALRQERVILFVNLALVALSAVVTWFVTAVTNGIDLAVLCLLGLLALRCVLSEFLLQRRLRIGIVRDLLAEAVLIVSFLWLSRWSHEWSALVVYLGLFALYIVVNRAVIVRSLRLVLGPGVRRA